MPEVLALLDVVLLTSHSEANPVCLLEAMASEKPVVATRVGSVGETVLEGRTGYLVAPGDWQRMADRVLELLADRARAAAMGRAGREAVIAHWSVDRMVQGYEDLIAGIYAGKCKRRQSDECRRANDEGRSRMTKEHDEARMTEFRHSSFVIRIRHCFVIRHFDLRHSPPSAGFLACTPRQGTIARLTGGGTWIRTSRGIFWPWRPVS